MVRSVTITAAVALMLSACANVPTDTAEAPGTRDCFNSRQITGFGPIDDHHVRLSVGANRHYSIATSMRVTEARFSQQVAVRSATDFICTGNGLGVELIIPDRTPDRYRITEIVRLPDDLPTGN